MASKVSVLVITTVAVVVAALFAGASAQTSSCTTAIVGLAPCLGYITGNTTTPSSSCCSQLSTVVKSEPQCLCLVLNGGAAQYGITINQTQAMTLPSACSVQTPPVSACAALAPAGSPTSSPTPPGPGGVKNTPTGGSSDGSTIRASFSWAFVLLVAYAVAGLTTF
uniref:Non-specific lipid-transfer protein-like protein At2g13820 n=1 Tax=Anthurium amnicola TaxID=1678845 RepID=A0A1D1XU69_9ARAE